jgi:hypothetical protein
MNLESGIVTSFVYNNWFTPFKYAIDVYVPLTFLGLDPHKYEDSYKLNE